MGDTHDPIAVGVSLLAILAGSLFSRRRKALRGEFKDLRGELNDLRGDM